MCGACAVRCMTCVPPWSRASGPDCDLCARRMTTAHMHPSSASPTSFQAIIHVAPIYFYYNSDVSLYQDTRLCVDVCGWKYTTIVRFIYIGMRYISVENN